MDASQTLSLSFLSNGYREKLNYLGTVSGRDEDKIAKTELTVVREGGTPYFEEADVAIIAKKLFAQPYDPACFIDQTIDQQWYPQKDYHTLYIAEIEDCLLYTSGITRKKAANYIARYFEEFRGVRAYMDEIIAQAHKDLSLIHI